MGRQSALVAAVRIHQVNFKVAIPIGLEGEPITRRRPGRIFVKAGHSGELAVICAVWDLVMRRDHSAARNIRREAMTLSEVGVSTTCLKESDGQS